MNDRHHNQRWKTNWSGFLPRKKTHRLWDKVTKDPQKEKEKQFGQKGGSEVHGNQKQILDKVFDFGSDTKQ